MNDVVTLTSQFCMQYGINTTLVHDIALFSYHVNLCVHLRRYVTIFHSAHKFSNTAMTKDIK